jgi:valyl-tRNA synthetase
MEIAKKYNPKVTEKKWYSYWLDKGYFNSIPNEKEAYTIVIPPPNVTGILHMGHMLNNTLQDVLVRRARMMGYNTCWVPGTDHASIATEAKVVAKLSKMGIDKSKLTREEFLSHAFEWKDEHGGIILDQLKKLGASCDWKRTKFTMDDDMSESVTKVFIDLFKKGNIYRGIRMINWDPNAQTAISDEEVMHKEVNSKLYYISYNIVDSEEQITIATTRPETILGDTAICVNPDDKRYSHLKGKKAIVPLIDRAIPIIFDEYVDMEFGTGALKITPAHDINDYQIGNKHNLEIIDILNDDGTLNNSAKIYIGKDRFIVRKEIAIELKKEGFLTKTDQYKNKVGYSERTNAIIEPKLSMQWFCRMHKLSEIALENVLNDNIKFHPAKFKNTYRHWMENIKDWCISRQLWWGHRIPAYFYDGNKFVVAENKEAALLLARKERSDVKLDDLTQDEDVLDTWFSSWIWPISVFDGIRNPNNKEITYYYPTNDLVTAPEILFFWVARMIMSGYEYKGDKPFKNVYLTGLVRDKLGRKMSKSLGNSPDPIKLIDKYGADGVRVGMLLCSPAGNDLPFDESLCEQGRNFSNKIWNAFRLIKSWEINECDQPESSKLATIWISNKISSSIKEIDLSYSKYRISEALMISYRLLWDDFCSWFLEIIKPEFGQPIDSKTFRETITQFERILKVLHPFMPFLTEEIWHLIDNKETDIIVSDWPNVQEINPQILEEFRYATEIIGKIRNIRKEKKISNKDKLQLEIILNNKTNNNLDSIIIKLANLLSIKQVSNKTNNALSFIINSNQYYIPFEDKIDLSEEIERLKKELEYTTGFLKITEAKLSNNKFVENAPHQLVENEKKKLIDAKEKIKILADKLSAIS